MANGKGPGSDRFKFLPAPGLRFKGAKFTGIDLDAAFETLLRDDEVCLGHKEILWAGISAWLKRSDDQSAAKKAIAKQTARTIMMAEVAARRQISSAVRWHNRPIGKVVTPTKAGALNGFAYSWTSADPEFQSLYTRIYFPIGGMKQVVAAFKSPTKVHKTSTANTRPRTRRTSGLRTLLQLAGVFDFHNRELSSDREQYGKPSVEKAARVLNKVKGGRVSKGGNGFSRTYVQELLKEHRNALALLYGANHVQISNTTLFDLLIEEKPGLETIAEHLPVWLAYAKDFHERVLSCAKGDWTKTYSPAIREVKSRRPAVTPYEAEEALLIKKAFREKSGMSESNKKS